MCRSIKLLRNTDNQLTDKAIREAALQFVRKISGYHKPSQANAIAFETAVDEITINSRNLLSALKHRESVQAR